MPASIEQILLNNLNSIRATGDLPRLRSCVESVIAALNRAGGNSRGHAAASLSPIVLIYCIEIAIHLSDYPTAARCLSVYDSFQTVVGAPPHTAEVSARVNICRSTIVLQQLHANPSSPQQKGSVAASSTEAAAAASSQATPRPEVLATCLSAVSIAVSALVAAAAAGDRLASLARSAEVAVWAALRPVYFPGSYADVAGVVSAVAKAVCDSVVFPVDLRLRWLQRVAVCATAVGATSEANAALLKAADLAPTPAALCRLHVLSASLSRAAAEARGGEDPSRLSSGDRGLSVSLVLPKGMSDERVTSLWKAAAAAAAALAIPLLGSEAAAAGLMVELCNAALMALPSLAPDSSQRSPANSAVPAAHPETATLQAIAASVKPTKTTANNTASTRAAPSVPSVWEIGLAEETVGTIAVVAAAWCAVSPRHVTLAGSNSKFSSSAYASMWELANVCSAIVRFAGSHAARSFSSIASAVATAAAARNTVWLFCSGIHLANYSAIHHAASPIVQASLAAVVQLEGVLLSASGAARSAAEPAAGQYRFIAEIAAVCLWNVILPLLNFVLEFGAAKALQPIRAAVTSLHQTLGDGALSSALRHLRVQAGHIAALVNFAVGHASAASAMVRQSLDINYTSVSPVPGPQQLTWVTDTTVTTGVSDRTTLLQDFHRRLRVSVEDIHSKALRDAHDRAIILLSQARASTSISALLHALSSAVDVLLSVESAPEQLVVIEEYCFAADEAAAWDGKMDLSSHSNRAARNKNKAAAEVGIPGSETVERISLWESVLSLAIESSRMDPSATMSQLFSKRAARHIVLRAAGPLLAVPSLSGRIHPSLLRQRVLVAQAAIYAVYAMYAADPTTPLHMLLKRAHRAISIGLILLRTPAASEQRHSRALLGRSVVISAAAAICDAVGFYMTTPQSAAAALVSVIPELSAALQAMFLLDGVPLTGPVMPISTFIAQTCPDVLNDRLYTQASWPDSIRAVTKILIVSIQARLCSLFGRALLFQASAPGSTLGTLTALISAGVAGEYAVDDEDGEKDASSMCPDPLLIAGAAVLAGGQQGALSVILPTGSPASPASLAARVDKNAVFDIASMLKQLGDHMEKVGTAIRQLRQSDAAAMRIALADSAPSTPDAQMPVRSLAAPVFDFFTISAVIRRVTGRPGPYDVNLFDLAAARPVRVDDKVKKIGEVVEIGAVDGAERLAAAIVSTVSFVHAMTGLTQIKRTPLLTMASLLARATPCVAQQLFGQAKQLFDHLPTTVARGSLDISDSIDMFMPTENAAVNIIGLGVRVAFAASALARMVVGINIIKDIVHAERELELHASRVRPSSHPSRGAVSAGFFTNIDMDAISDALVNVHPATLRVGELSRVGVYLLRGKSLQTVFPDQPLPSPHFILPSDLVNVTKGDCVGLVWALYAAAHAKSSLVTGVWGSQMPPHTRFQLLEIILRDCAIATSVLASASAINSIDRTRPLVELDSEPDSCGPYLRTCGPISPAVPALLAISLIPTLIEVAPNEKHAASAAMKPLLVISGAFSSTNEVSSSLPPLVNYQTLEVPASALQVYIPRIIAAANTFAVSLLMRTSPTKAVELVEQVLGTVAEAYKAPLRVIDAASRTASGMNAGSSLSRIRALDSRTQAQVWLTLSSGALTVASQAPSPSNAFAEAFLPIQRAAIALLSFKEKALLPETRTELFGELCTTLFRAAVMILTFTSESAVRRAIALLMCARDVIDAGAITEETSETIVSLFQLSQDVAVSPWSTVLAARTKVHARDNPEGKKRHHPRKPDTPKTPKNAALSASLVAFRCRIHILLGIIALCCKADGAGLQEFCIAVGAAKDDMNDLVHAVCDKQQLVLQPTTVLVVSDTVALVDAVLLLKKHAAVIGIDVSKFQEDLLTVVESLPSNDYADGITNTMWKSALSSDSANTSLPAGFEFRLMAGHHTDEAQARKGAVGVMAISDSLSIGGSGAMARLMCARKHMQSARLVATDVERAEHLSKAAQLLNSVSLQSANDDKLAAIRFPTRLGQAELLLFQNPLAAKDAFEDLLRSINSSGATIEDALAAVKGIVVVHCCSREIHDALQAAHENMSIIYKASAEVVDISRMMAAAAILSAAVDITQLIGASVTSAAFGGVSGAVDCYRGFGGVALACGSSATWNLPSFLDRLDAGDNMVTLRVVPVLERLIAFLEFWITETSSSLTFAEAVPIPLLRAKVTVVALLLASASLSTSCGSNIDVSTVAKAAEALFFVNDVLRKIAQLYLPPSEPVDASPGEVRDEGAVSGDIVPDGSSSPTVLQHVPWSLDLCVIAAEAARLTALLYNLHIVGILRENKPCASSPGEVDDVDASASFLAPKEVDAISPERTAQRRLIDIFMHITDVQRAAYMNGRYRSALRAVYATLCITSSDAATKAAILTASATVPPPGSKKRRPVQITDTSALSQETKTVSSELYNSIAALQKEVADCQQTLENVAAASRDALSDLLCDDLFAPILKERLQLCTLINPAAVQSSATIAEQLLHCTTTSPSSEERPPTVGGTVASSQAFDAPPSSGATASLDEESSPSFVGASIVEVPVREDLTETAGIRRAIVSYIAAARSQVAKFDVELQDAARQYGISAVESLSKAAQDTSLGLVVRCALSGSAVAGASLIPDVEALNRAALVFSRSLFDPPSPPHACLVVEEASQSSLRCGPKCSLVAVGPTPDLDASAIVAATSAAAMRVRLVGARVHNLVAASPKGSKGPADVDAPTVTKSCLFENDVPIDVPPSVEALLVSPLAEGFEALDVLGSSSSTLAVSASVSLCISRVVAASATRVLDAAALVAGPPSPPSRSSTAGKSAVRSKSPPPVESGPPPQYHLPASVIPTMASMCSELEKLGVVLPSFRESRDLLPLTTLAAQFIASAHAFEATAWVQSLLGEASSPDSRHILDGSILPRIAPPTSPEAISRIGFYLPIDVIAFVVHLDRPTSTFHSAVFCTPTAGQHPVGTALVTPVDLASLGSLCASLSSFALEQYAVHAALRSGSAASEGAYVAGAVHVSLTDIMRGIADAFEGPLSLLRSVSAAYPPLSVRCAMLLPPELVELPVHGLSEFAYFTAVTQDIHLPAFEARMKHALSSGISSTEADAASLLSSLATFSPSFAWSSPTVAVGVLDPYSDFLGSVPVSMPGYPLGLPNSRSIAPFAASPSPGEMGSAKGTTVPTIGLYRRAIEDREAAEREGVVGRYVNFLPRAMSWSSVLADPPAVAALVSEKVAAAVHSPASHCWYQYSLLTASPAPFALQLGDLSASREVPGLCNARNVAAWGRIVAMDRAGGPNARSSRARIDRVASSANWIGASGDRRVCPAGCGPPVASAAATSALLLALGVSSFISNRYWVPLDFASATLNLITLNGPRAAAAVHLGIVHPPALKDKPTAPKGDTKKQVKAPKEKDVMREWQCADVVFPLSESAPVFPCDRVSALAPAVWGVM